MSLPILTSQLIMKWTYEFVICNPATSSIWEKNKFKEKHNVRIYTHTHVHTVNVYGTKNPASEFWHGM